MFCLAIISIYFFMVKYESEKRQAHLFIWCSLERIKKIDEFVTVVKFAFEVSSLLKGC